MSIMNFFSQLVNIVKAHTLSKTAFFKRRVYGEYSYLSKCRYLSFLFLSFFADIVLIIWIFYILKHIECVNYMNNFYKAMLLPQVSQVSSYVSLLLLLLSLIFFIILTYNLLFYPRLYLMGAQPTCIYSYKGTRKRGIILDMSHNKALIENICNNNNKILRLVNINRIIYINKKLSTDNKINVLKYEIRLLRLKLKLLKRIKKSK